MYKKYFTKDAFKSYIENVDEKLKNAVITARKMYGAPSCCIIKSNADPASEVYVRNKFNLATKLGINMSVFNITTNFKDFDSIVKVVDYGIKEYHACMLQYPIMNEAKRLHIPNDPDGLHGTDITPCTPLGIKKHLEYLTETTGNPWYGKTMLIIGRSALVGKPMCKVANDLNMTYMLAHSYTPPEVLQKLVQQADVIVVAVGIPEWFVFEPKENAIIYDVGINKTPDGIVGDVLKNITETHAVSPVPGGVGLLTTRALMNNILALQEKNEERSYY